MFESNIKRSAVKQAILKSTVANEAKMLNLKAMFFSLIFLICFSGDRVGSLDGKIIIKFFVFFKCHIINIHFSWNTLFLGYVTREWIVKSFNEFQEAREVQKMKNNYKILQKQFFSFYFFWCIQLGSHVDSKWMHHRLQVQNNLDNCNTDSLK